MSESFYINIFVNATFARNISKNLTFTFLPQLLTKLFFAKPFFENIDLETRRHKTILRFDLF